MPDRVDEALELARLAALDPLSYEREREEAAEKLGIRVATLDRLVAIARGEQKKGQGRPLTFPDTEPWPEAVDGAALLSDLAGCVRRYVVVAGSAADAAALWAVHTWLYERFMITPRLAIKSAQKRSGKTTLLMVLSALVPRPLPTANTTPAAVYRAAELASPVLLIDEADRFLNNNPELVGLLNAGFQRGGQVLRVIGEDYDPRQFACHVPAALATIGHFSDTIEDRSIAIGLIRRRVDETIEPLDLEVLVELGPLRRRIARWIADHARSIAGRRPERLTELHDRANDCWRVLRAIAEEAGGEWPERARRAALVLTANDDVETRTTLLLRDIREVFEKAAPAGEKLAEVLFSGELVAGLLSYEDHGWVEMGRDRKPLTQARLARMLQPFAIVPEVRWRNRGSPHAIAARGYAAEQFEDAWSRYL
jgi:putative DNA primase/helicase